VKRRKHGSFRSCKLRARHRGSDELTQIQPDDTRLLTNGLAIHYSRPPFQFVSSRFHNFYVLGESSPSPSTRASPRCTYKCFRGLRVSGTGPQTALTLLFATRYRRQRRLTALLTDLLLAWRVLAPGYTGKVGVPGDVESLR